MLNMYIGYNEVEIFYKFLYEKPKYIVFESDHIINRNSGKYPNDGLIYYKEDISRLIRTQPFRRTGKNFSIGN